MKISVIFGTPPGAIKLAPVILALRSDPRFQCRVCITAQHREMLDQQLKLQGIDAAIQGLGRCIPPL
jgi:UDP-N-acetylglucosamine 2-epimerase